MTVKKIAKDESESATKSSGLGPFLVMDRAMDLEFVHPTQIYSLRPCRNQDATDLLAVGGEHSVDIVQVVCTLYPAIHPTTKLLGAHSLSSNCFLSHWLTDHCSRLVVPHSVPIFY